MAKLVIIIHRIHTGVILPPSIVQFFSIVVGHEIIVIIMESSIQDQATTKINGNPQVLMSRWQNVGHTLIPGKIDVFDKITRQAATTTTLI